MNREYNIFFFLYLIIIVIICVNNGNANQIPISCPVVCPNLSVTVNLSNPVEETAYIRGLVPKLWDSKAFRPPSCLVTELKNILLEMLGTDYRPFRQVAGAHIIFASTYLSIGAQDINMCVDAQGINATIALVESNDIKFAAETLRLISKNYKPSRRIITKSSLQAAGCKNADPLKTPPCCYKNGMVYPIEKMWSLYGRMLPCGLKEVVMKLYNSKDNVDRGHAVVITTILSPFLGGAVGVLPRASLYETLEMLATSDIPAVCCDNRKARFDTIIAERDAAMKKRVEQVIKEKYTETCTKMPSIKK